MSSSAPRDRRKATASSHWPATEIVSADALQAYRGLDIGTAKPSLDERALVPHHLIDILDPDVEFSAGEFARRARQAIHEIEERDAVQHLLP